MIPFTRIMTVVMFGVLCAVIAMLAFQAHNFYMMIGFPILYAIYVVVNLMLWKRLKQRS
jgi:uncharacterized membrane protein YjjP (DUF1212 family)